MIPGFAVFFLKQRLNGGFSN